MVTNKVFEPKLAAAAAASQPAWPAPTTITSYWENMGCKDRPLILVIGMIKVILPEMFDSKKISKVPRENVELFQGETFFHVER
jgi:hypothetical protein